MSPSPACGTDGVLGTGGRSDDSLVRPAGSFWVDVLPALVAAAGMALAFIPFLGVALSLAPAGEGGLAAGIVNTSYQVGSSLGLAVMTALAGAQGAGRLGDPTALTNGYSAAFLVPAAVSLGGAVLVAVGLHLRRPATYRHPHPQPTSA